MPEQGENNSVFTWYAQCYDCIERISEKKGLRLNKYEIIAIATNLYAQTLGEIQRANKDSEGNTRFTGNPFDLVNWGKDE